MPAMVVLEAVCDTSVALKWFHHEGEEMLRESRAILTAHRDGRALAYALDLTAYELPNALLRGGPSVTAAQAVTVLDSLRELCVLVPPTAAEMRHAVELAELHGLTVYDAAYASVAERRGATLVTMDRAILAASLGETPADFLIRLASDA